MIWFVFGFAAGLIVGFIIACLDLMAGLKNPAHFWEHYPTDRGRAARRCLKCQRYEVDHGAGFVVVSEGRACNDANAHA